MRADCAAQPATTVLGDMSAKHREGRLDAFARRHLPTRSHVSEPPSSSLHFARTPIKIDALDVTLCHPAAAAGNSELKLTS
jgi:hypothetical protein